MTPSHWQDFTLDPFSFLDNHSFKIRGRELNVLKNHAILRDVIYKLSFFTAIVWAVNGFDSGTGQIEYLLTKIPELLMNKITFKEYLAFYSWAYGKTMHWSAFVIYGLLYVGISNYLEQGLGIEKTRNSIYSFAFTLSNIALFEYFWMYSFAIFQNQKWVITWGWPQVKILGQNLLFTIAGLFMLAYMWEDSHIFESKGHFYRLPDFKLMGVIGKRYSFSLNWRLILILLTTIAGAYFWINYPGPVEHFTVDIVGMSPWTNSAKFPQTLYTIDMDITDKSNMGTWFYVENDLIHLVNTIVKVLFAYTQLVFVESWKKT